VTSGDGQPGFRHRRAITQGTVGSHGIVFLAPKLDQHLRPLQGIEDLPVEQLILQLAREALVVTIL
jgi:hypothetical protein